MIHAGLAEYAGLLAGMGGATLTGFEPGFPFFAILGCLIFLFWLIVFKL